MSNDTRCDQAARRAVGAELDKTLFVEAGAGSGKTTSLVERILALLDDGVAMENIAAITFTEKAAAELRNRVHQMVQERLSESERIEQPFEAERYRTALDQLDGAAITTLHGFALRILSQHAIEAELPPRFEVSPLEAFEDRWEEIRDNLLDSPEHRQTVLLARVLAIDISKLRQLAGLFDDNWDLVENRIVDDTPLMLPKLSHLPDRYREVAELSRHCQDSQDRMMARLHQIGEMGERLRQVADNSYETIRLLFGSQPSFKSGTTGRKVNWLDSFPLADVRDKVSALGDVVQVTRAQVTDAVIEDLARVLGEFIVSTAGERRGRGVLEFHDLLVLARRVLCHPEHGPRVRAALADRYRRLLLDEVQDTDPIQLDIAGLIGAAGSDDGRCWAELTTEPGRLFFVGDPKQSIYRFRRADIALFMQVQQTAAFEQVSLTRNFRSVEPVLTWVNDLFDGFMAPPSESGLDIQPYYQPLTPVRGRPPTGPPVIVLGSEEHPTRTLSVGDMRAVEAAGVADVILTAVNQRWSVDDGSEGWRSARLEDICVLLQTRTSLPQLEQALDDAAIPYRIEAGSLVWASRAVRDLMSIVRTVADPTDEVALVNALRSPAFGCGDDDLYTFKVVHRGRWDYLSPLPAGLSPDHPVGEAMGWLAGLHAQCRWLSPSELIGLIVRDRRLMELGCFGPRRARDVWRSLRLVVEHARTFGATERAAIAGKTAGSGLREFVAWVDRKVERQDRESDAILAESDDDAVRITTIHGAKGREFPIVIVSGTYAGSSPSKVDVVWPPDGGYGVKFTKDLSTATYREHQERENMMAYAERVRLLYVALTRARDHLVVSVHRLGRSANSTAAPSLAEMVVDHAAELPELALQPQRRPIGQPPR